MIASGVSMKLHCNREEMRLSRLFFAVIYIAYNGMGFTEEQKFLFS